MAFAPSAAIVADVFAQQSQRMPSNERATSRTESEERSPCRRRVQMRAGTVSR